MKKYLIQKRWFRQLTGKLYYFANDQWINSEDFKRGMKLEKAEGWKNSLNWCSCGNELSHSDSFIKQLENGVWEYKCSHCDKHQYKNGTLGMFIIECDEIGRPFTVAIL